MALLQRHHQQIVNTRARICAHIHDVGINDFDERPNHLAGRYAEKLVFLRRLPHDGTGINRISAPGDFADVKDRKLGSLRIMAEVIAEWSLHPPLDGRVGAYDHRHVQIFALALGFPIMSAAAFHVLPMHTGCVFAEYLKTIKPEISPPRDWMLGEDYSVSDETPGIARPA